MRHRFWWAAEKHLRRGWLWRLCRCAPVSRIRDGHEQTAMREQNAISDAAEQGVSLEGATIYITHFPCINCAKILAAAGIKRIKYHCDYRNDDLVKDILAESGLALEQL